MPLLVFLLACTAGCASSLSEGRYAGEALPSTIRIDRLVVHKSEQRLDAFFHDELLKSYRVQTGFSSGAKGWEGDERTPEGTYRIDARYPSTRFRRFLHVSYPNASDRDRYRQLKQEGIVPEGRGVGSAIGIHGESDTVGGQIATSFGMNWTAGCIAVSDDDIEELYRAVLSNAPILILP